MLLFGYNLVKFFAIVTNYDCKIRLISLKNKL